VKEQTSNILKQYNEEFTKEWRDFLQTLNIAELKEDESCGHLIKHYECGIFFSTQFNENLPNIVIKSATYHPLNYDHLQIRVEEEKLEKIESTSFFGKKKVEEIRTIKVKMYLCYPFLSFENLSDELKKLSAPRCMGGYYPSIYEYAELDNLASILKHNKVKSKVDFNTIELIKAFIDDKIKLYSEKEKNTKQEVEIQLSNLDKDGNGIVDILESSDDFKSIISKYQKEIIDIDKTYIHKFIKISKYLDDKKANIQFLYNTRNDYASTIEKVDFIGILNNQIHLFELTMLHSISMIISLIENDLITFYEIYETFDRINIFNSNWENEVSQKLTEIDNNLGDLIYSIQDMEMKISKEIKHLTYVTNSSFDNLNRSINTELKSINSSIKFNNLLEGIQAYQMYKINKNTKN
jgi:hypothetical protein